MRYRAIIFESVNGDGDYPLQVRDIFEGNEKDTLQYALDMEAEDYIHSVHVEEATA